MRTSSLNGARLAAEHVGEVAGARRSGCSAISASTAAVHGPVLLARSSRSSRASMSATSSARQFAPCSRASCAGLRSSTRWNAIRYTGTVVVALQPGPASRLRRARPRGAASACVMRAGSTTVDRLDLEDAAARPVAVARDDLGALPAPERQRDRTVRIRPGQASIENSTASSVETAISVNARWRDAPKRAAMDGMFNDDHRYWQDRFDSRRIADRIDELLVSETIDAHAKCVHRVARHVLPRDV